VSFVAVLGRRGLIFVVGRGDASGPLIRMRWSRDSRFSSFGHRSDATEQDQRHIIDERIVIAELYRIECDGWTEKTVIFVNDGVARVDVAYRFSGRLWVRLGIQGSHPMRVRRERWKVWSLLL
jgi:hypothetical protein